MADQPKSTADILAAIRNKGGPGGSPAEGEAKSQETAPAPAEPAAPQAPKPTPAAESPKGTSDILSAIRAKNAAAGGEPATAKPAPAAAGEAAPKGSSDIMAAIRAKGAGGAAAETPAADKPKSPADIMAAIRGGGGAAAPKPAAAKPPAGTKAAPAKPAGEKPSVQEMLKAVREGKQMPAPGAPKTPPRLPAGKPAAARAAVKPVSRRNVFAPVLALIATPFALAWSLMTLIVGVWTLKGAQFMIPNMVLELPSRFKVGVTSDYPLGTVSEKYKASRGVWIVHTDQYDGGNLIYALASVCTHLGCTPNWLEGEQKYKCPCHGSGFYISGVNFEGPAPRPLERVGIRISEDGQIEVDKSVKFQEELGQWADPKSFVELV